MKADTESVNKSDKTFPEPSWDDLEKAHEEFKNLEPRAPVYEISTKYIREYWNDAYEISNAIGILLLIWNSAFYRFGRLNYCLIQCAINLHREKLEELRKRDISELREDMKDEVSQI